MDIKPYEISIWRDELNTELGIYEEKKVAVIGSNIMTTDSRAIAPKLTKNVNGSITLDFSLYTHYFDLEEQDYIENPFIKLISNETKIKLKYNDEWYDFIVKNIDETSDTKLYNYTTEALFINELAKNGFGIVFDTELENSTGSIQELIEATLEGTDWKLDNENSELIQQFDEEPLMVAQLNSGNTLSAHYKTFSKEEGEESYNIVDITIPANSIIYIPYSTILNRDPLFQFFWAQDGNYQLDDNNIILNSECYYVGNYNFNNFNTQFSTAIENLVISEYRGNRLVLSPKVVWDNRFEKFMNVYTKDDDEYYGYTTTEYITTDIVFDLVTNPKDFQSYTGWEVSNPLSIDSDIYPPIMESGEYNPDSTSYLKFTCANTNDYFYNTGFTDNRKRFIPSDSYSGGLIKGSKYVLEYNIFNGEIPTTLVTPQIQVATYSINGTSLVKDTTIMTFSSNNAQVKYHRVAVTEDNYEQNTYYIYNEQNGSFVLDDSVAFDANKLYYNRGTFYITTITEPISYSDMLNKKIGIFINFDSTGTYWIKNLDIYQYQEGLYGSLITIDPVAIQGFYQIHYFYYNVDLNKDKKTSDDILSEESIGPDPNFIQVYDEFYTKRRAYENSESNRFNIIQDLCELFECWVEFKILHEEDGSISRDENGQQEKYVIIKKFIGKENFAGFRYGINLKQIKRDIDSGDLVSKIIVKDNTNELGQDGFCSISRAKENPCGENFLYDFRHYYNTGLLNYAQVLNDLYTYSPNYISIGEISYEDFISEPYGTYYTFNNFQYQRAQEWKPDIIYYIDSGSTIGWLGYYKRMKQANSSREDFIKKQSALYLTIIDLESSLQVYENLKNESYKEFTNIVNTYINEFCLPFTYDDYTSTEANLYWKLGKVSRDFFTIHKPLYIKNGSSYIEASEYSISESYYAGKDTKYPQEGDTEATVQLKTFGEMLESIKNYNAMASNLASAKLAENKALRATNLYNEYYKALYGNGADPATDGYLEGAQREYDRYAKYLEDIKLEKEVLNSLFYAKYSRFIQEGTWTDDNYIDDNLYFYDAQNTLSTSAQPKVTYTISIIEVSEIEDLENYIFDVGDKTYMEDTEFFGWVIKDAVKTPYQEEVFITEVTWNLNSPENNTIKVQNYKTRFEDLFQRITATTTSLEFAEGSFQRAAAVVNSDGTISASSLQASFSQNAITLSNIKEQTVVWDDTGITISTPSDPNHIVRIVNQGIYMFDGQTWNLGISGDGINANYINVGQLDTSKIRIMNSGWTTFMWDTNGITAYAFTPSGDSINVTLDKFVRLDQYGIYGINGQAEFIATSLKDITDNAIFGLTWNGFFLNSIHGDKRIRISSDKDIQILVPDTRSGKEGELIERVKLGLIDETEDIYGLLLKDNLDQKTLYTGSNGELWLSQAMTIAEDSNNDPIVKIGYGAGNTTRGNYKEVIHAGTDSGDQKKFIVYEDGYMIANGGKIGGLEIEEISDLAYSIDITSNLGFTVANKECPILTCHVYHENVEIYSTPEHQISYQWTLDDNDISGATNNYYIVTISDWNDTNILRYGCKVIIQNI